MLSEVSTATLERLREGLRSYRLDTPLTTTVLNAFGIKEQVGTILEALADFERPACLAIVEAVLTERTSAALRSSLELVWTGPEGNDGKARDTAVVLRNLFESAQDRVLLAGFSFKKGEEALRPLHESMVRGVNATFFIGIKQPESPVDPDAYAQRSFDSFLEQRWPFGQPVPKLYCDRRSLYPGPPWSSLHAKCVVVDGERALVSSANFTERGQERNIETGVLIRDESFASLLERQWMSLVVDSFVVERQRSI